MTDAAEADTAEAVPADHEAAEREAADREIAIREAERQQRREEWMRERAAELLAQERRYCAIVDELLRLDDLDRDLLRARVEALPRDQPLANDEESFRRSAEVVATLPAERSARRVDLGRGWDQLARLCVSRGERWCRSFVDVLVARRQRESYGAYRVARPLLDHWNLPTPDAASFTAGWLSARLFDDGRWAREPRVPVPDMVDLFSADPRCADLWPQALTYDLTLPDFAEVTVGLIERGALDRQVLLQTCRAVLSGTSRATTQHSIAGILTRLKPGTDELGELPFLIGCITTSRVSVTKLLLPHAISLLSDEADTLELAAVLAGRSDKGPRQTFVHALSRRDLRKRLGVETVRAGLELFVDDPDAALAARARNVLAELADTAHQVAAPGTAPTPVATQSGPVPASDLPEPLGLWDLLPELTLPTPWQRPAQQAVPTMSSVTADTVRDRILDELEPGDPTSYKFYRWQRRSDAEDEQVLEFLTRAAWRDPDAVRGRLITWVDNAAAPPPKPQGYHPGWTSMPGMLNRGLRVWRAALRDGVPSAIENLYAALERGRWDGHYRDGALDWSLLLALETFLRLGSSPGLLSTPSEPDGRLGFGIFSDRLAARAGGSVGAVDLALALRRVGPQRDPDLSPLAGIRVAVDAVCTQPDGHTHSDAVEIATSWFSDFTAWPPLRPVTPRPGYGGPIHWRADPLPELPMSLPAALSDPNQCAGWLRLNPTWPDAHYIWQTSPSRADPYNSLDDEHFLAYSLIAGVPTYDALLGRLCFLAGQVDGADPIVHALLTRQVNVDSLVSAALFRAENKAPSLPALTKSFDQLILLGGLRQLWRPMLQIAAGLLAHKPLPAGTADLLRALAAVVHEVPNPVIPAPILQLAQGRSTTKAAAEARLLVARADVVQQSHAAI